ncbi:MAG: DMT family transporter [Sphingomonadaceae bacterium]
MIAHSSVGWLWVPFTLAAATMQVFRNATQARLSAKAGPLGGTQARFLFGLPMAIALFVGFMLLSGERVPPIGPEALGWVVAGALVQIFGTWLMLVVMAKRDFGVAYAYIKTEPVIVALFGLILLGQNLPVLGWVAVMVVTCGVVMASLRKGDSWSSLAEWKPVLTGVGSGGLFGLATICFSAAIHAEPQGSFLMRSLVMLVISLSIQTVILLVWFASTDLAPLRNSLREWRLCVVAGMLGGSATACWFIAYSQTIAANVRTLALIEMPVVALVSRGMAGRWLSRREAVGFALITGGVALLLIAHGA